MKILVIGSHGVVGKQFISHFQGRVEMVSSEAHPIRGNYQKQIETEIDLHRPTHVISFVGRTAGPGHPNISYLDQPGNLDVNLRDNLFSPLLIGMIAEKHQIHYTYVGTGCIYEGYPEDGFRESDEPNRCFSDKETSYYIVKTYTDLLISQLNNALVARIRLPVTSFKDNRNLLTKVIKFKEVHNYGNSISVLPTLFDPLLELMKKDVIGPLNLCNPGLITIPEILEIVREETGMELEYTIVPGSSRANTHLNTERLEEIVPGVLGIKEAIRTVVKKVFLDN